MDEAGYWSERLRPKLIATCQKMAYRHHFERVENGVADGTPDVDYCISGVEGHIELKYATSHPVRPSSQVLSVDKGLRRSQIVWASRRSWAGGRTWCMIGTPDTNWLFDLRVMSPALMATLATASVHDLNNLCVWHSARHTWEALVRKLVDANKGV